MSMLCLAGAINAQIRNQYIPSAASQSNGLATYAVGKIYVEPIFLAKKTETEEISQDTLPTDKHEKLLVFYPNPVKDVIRFYTKSATLPQTYVIYQQNGSVVQSGKISSESIDINYLSRGTYLLKTDLEPNQQYTILKN